jgi:hypothetical protein
MNEKNEIINMRHRILSGQLTALDRHIEFCKLKIRRLRSKEKIGQMQNFIEELQFIKKFVIFTGRRYFNKEFLRELFGIRITSQEKAHKLFLDLMTFVKEWRGRYG